MKFWKRNGVIAALILFVGTAVYLNWSYGKDAQQADVETAQTAAVAGEKILGQPVLVGSGDVTLPAGSEAEAGNDYFASARLTRQQARDAALSLLKEEDSETMAEHIQTLASCTMAESRIENLVTAKGYQDCVAFIGENSISVVVETETGALEAADVARITDIIKGETAFSKAQIKIVPTEAALGA